MKYEKTTASIVLSVAIRENNKLVYPWKSIYLTCSSIGHTSVSWLNT